jgi:hypothetical protein
MKTWRDKADRTIAELCMAAFKAANTKRDGSRYKKHRPYSVPEKAAELANLLGWKDQKAAEIRAKQIFVYELR